jgi:hypothetical protein
MKGLLLSLTCCVFVGIVCAQEITVTGKIIDGNTQKPILFADIFMEKTGIGTISNDDGTFILNVPVGSLNDSVKITHIGYSVYINTFAGLQALHKDIELVVAPKLLDEVVIRPLYGAEISKKAFENASENYSRIPYGMKAFFRGNVAVDGKIIELVEALMDIKYSAYNGEKAAFEIKPLKGRRAGDADSCEAFRALPASSHVDNLFYEDMVHKRKKFLLIDFAENSDIRVTDIIDFDGMQVYEIEFDERANVSKPMFKGKLFIDSKSLAIVRVEYGNSPNGDAYDQFNATQAAVPDSVLHYKHEGYYVTMNYKKRDSTWYLDDVVGDYYYHAMREGGKVNSSIDSKIVIHSELFVTDVDTKHAVKGNLGGVRHREDWIFNKIKNYDPNYWEHINYIVPSKRINAIVDTLSNAKQ